MTNYNRYPPKIVWREVIQFLVIVAACLVLAWVTVNYL